MAKGFAIREVRRPARLNRHSTHPKNLPASIFPHIVSGTGYTTEFLLLSSGGRASGSVDFVSQPGVSTAFPIRR